MTPAAFTKLGIRLLVLYLAFFVAMPLLFFTVPLAVASPAVDNLVSVIQGVALLVIPALGWLKADYILARLLPAKASRDTGPGYAQLETLGVMAMGGFLILGSFYWLAEVTLTKDASRAIQGVITLLFGALMVWGVSTPGSALLARLMVRSGHGGKS